MRYPSFAAVRTRSMKLAVVMAAATLSLATVGRAATSVAETSSTLTPQRVTQLAEQGEFHQLLADLKASNIQGPYTKGLIVSLERYAKNQQRRNAWRKQAFDLAVAKMSKSMDENKLEDGLVAAIDAKSHAANRDAFITSSSVVQLIARSIEAANKAEQKGDWIEALGYFRLMDLLFSESATYREDVERASQHVRVLQLYAPEHLRELVEKQRQRRGVALDDDTPDPEPEQWTARLAGIDVLMLYQAVPMIAAAHVESPDMADVLKGGIDALTTMLNTPNLDKTFPSLGKAKQVNRFRELLTNLRASLSQPGEQVDQAQAQAIINRIIAMNQLTVYLPEPVIVYELTQGMIGITDRTI